MLPASSSPVPPRYARRRRARNAPDATVTLLAALLAGREREVTDNLVTC
ncbi:hypothetical protein [Nonomuraea sp. NPDC049480]